MNRLNRHWLILSLPVLFWAGTVKADTCPQCATFVQQLVDNVTFVNQLNQQMQMVQQQMTMVSQGAQNLANLPTQNWTSFTGQLNQMMGIVGIDESHLINLHESGCHD